MEKGIIELKESGVVVDDVEKKLRTTGVRGLDFEKARELGFFNRISNLLCAMHASVMAGFRIYGGVDYLLSEFNGRRNEIQREMNAFEKAFARFTNFWTDYYAHGDANREVNDETETLYRRIMDWAQLPFEWCLGDKQRVDDNNNIEQAIRVDVDGKQYTFYKTILKGDTIGEQQESWCVTKYDTSLHKQVTIEKNMDKASAMMVAKRLSNEDKDNIYTAGIVRDYVEKKTDITPFKAYKANETIGSLMKVRN